MVCSSAWPMCRLPVTFGGGSTIEYGGLAAGRVRREVARIQPLLVDRALHRGRIPRLGQVGGRAAAGGHRSILGTAELALRRTRKRLDPTASACVSCAVSRAVRPDRSGNSQHLARAGSGQDWGCRWRRRSPGTCCRRRRSAPRWPTACRRIRRCTSARRAPGRVPRRLRRNDLGLGFFSGRLFGGLGRRWRRRQSVSVCVDQAGPSAA